MKFKIKNTIFIVSTINFYLLLRENRRNLTKQKVQPVTSLQELCVLYELNMEFKVIELWRPNYPQHLSHGLLVKKIQIVCPSFI